jgi:hypothetical protein
MQNYLKLGDWNAICDVCGFKFKASTMLKRWDGLMVCKQDYEVRHPQDFIRGIKDDPSVPWSRPETDLFIEPTFCTVVKKQGVAGMGGAGCMVAGFASSNLI